MKKVLILLIVLCMVVVFVACGKSAEEKVAEQIAEKIAEEMTEGIVDVDDISVDSDEGTVTIGDGEDKVVIEGSESGMPWPKDKLPSNVPELKGATVVSVASTEGGILIGFEDCDEGEANAYREQIKNAGWNIMMDASEEDGGMVMATSASGESLMFIWNTEDQAGAVTYSSAQ